MASIAFPVSGPTESWVGLPCAAPTRFNVTPEIAPVIVLLALEYGMPSMVREAFVPPDGALKFKVVVLAVIASAPGVPVAVLVMARRAPSASVTTDAEI